MNYNRTSLPNLHPGLNTSKTSTNALKATNKIPLRTSNPDVFPSLNPLGSFYKQRKFMETTPISKLEAEIFESEKKVKLNNGYSLNIQNRKDEKNHYEISDENDEFKSIEEYLVDKDNFRIPKIPKRFYLRNRHLNQGKIQDKVLNKDVKNTKINKDSLSFSNNIFNEMTVKDQTSKKPLQVQDPRGLDCTLEGSKVELEFTELDLLVLQSIYEKLKEERRMRDAMASLQPEQKQIFSDLNVEESMFNQIIWTMPFISSNGTVH